MLRSEEARNKLLKTVECQYSCRMSSYCFESGGQGPGSLRENRDNRKLSWDKLHQSSSDISLNHMAASLTPMIPLTSDSGVSDIFCTSTLASAMPFSRP